MKLETKGLSSHTNSGFDCGTHLKLELICDDTNENGYTLIVDSENDKNLFSEFLTTDGTLKKETVNFVLSEIKKNETVFLRMLLKNSSYSKAGEDQYMYNCEAGKNQDMSGCKAGEDQDMSGCKAGKNQDMSGCEATTRTISYMHSGNNVNNEFIDRLSNEAPNNKLDWDYLVKLARKGYERSKK